MTRYSGHLPCRIRRLKQMQIPQSGEDLETNPTMQGYDELRDGAAWLEMSGRGKIRVAGEDRARFLHAMTTNHIQQLTPGKGCYAFFLTAQGRILADVNVLCRPDSFLLDTEPAALQKVLEHRDKFIIADDVTLEDLTPTFTTIAVEGPKFADVLSAATAPALEAGYGANVQRGSGLLQRVLRAVEIDRRAPPEPRTKLQIDGTSVGEITSAAYSPALGKVVALAYIRVAQAETGTEMVVGEMRAHVR